jgi:hypothetical protein
MAAIQFYLNSGEQRKVEWVGEDTHVGFGKKIAGKREVLNGALSWCNNLFFCRQSPGRSLHTFLRGRRKRLQ